MNSYKFLSYLFLIATLVMSSCRDFEELEKDPNRPLKVPASLVFNGILNDMNQGAWNDVMRWNQFYNSNYNYYANNEYNWTATDWNYTTLKNVVKMEEEAKRGTLEEAKVYAALGKFFRAYFFINMTRRVGDIPMTEALKGIENTEPVYDTQKSVYTQSLQWLEEANSEIAQLIAANATPLTGDIYLDNQLGKWQKVINTYTLRVLISLSKKENEADLNIKQKFAQILNNPAQYPIMESMEDNMQFIYNNTFNKYPRSRDNFGFNATRENMSATYLNTLAALKDPRTFVVAEPAQAKLDAGLQPTDYAAFVGASSGEDLADMSSKAGKGEYSFQNRHRYYDGYTAEPTIVIGYPELCFNIAEAINRGWVTGDAEAFYKKGIMASMGFYGIKNGDNKVYFLPQGSKLGEYQEYTVNVNLDEYYNQPAVAYAGNNAEGLKQILTQKYLAFFQNSGWEAFYNQRRTGTPAFLTGPGTGNSQRIPRRWQYPSSERVTNEAHLNEALERQFGTATDDINAEMWLLK